MYHLFLAQSVFIAPSVILSIYWAHSSVASSSWSLFCIVRGHVKSCVNLPQKSLVSVNQHWVVLLHYGIYPFGLRVGIDGSTIWNGLVVNDPLIIHPDIEHHLVFEIHMLVSRFQSMILV